MCIRDSPWNEGKAMCIPRSISESIVFVNYLVWSAPLMIWNAHKLRRFMGYAPLRILRLTCRRQPDIVARSRTDLRIMDPDRANAMIGLTVQTIGCSLVQTADNEP